ncbi:hypothetical protein LIER_21524 [Lithospermum erythrorhizon]|uniref:Uncharacterized protein n=1 Tax=Lithospermum erythrorhizon TaxID=34254 RepID=A0AAV3QUP9_LITER
MQAPSKNMMNAPMAEMPNNPPLQQHAFQFYTGKCKEQRNLVPLSMTYAKSEVVENVDPGNSKNDGNSPSWGLQHLQVRRIIIFQVFLDGWIGKAMHPLAMKNVSLKRNWSRWVG